MEVARNPGAEGPPSDATATFNHSAVEHDIRIQLLTGGLEQAMLAGCGEVTLEELMDELGNPDIEPSELERWLKKRKSPWMRAVLGEGTPWSQLSPDVVAVVERWLEGVLTRREARAMLRDLGARLSVRR